MIEPTATSVATLSSGAHASRPMHHPRSAEIRTTSVPTIHPPGDVSTAYVSLHSVPPALRPNITLLPLPPEWTAPLPPMPNFTFPSSGGHYTDPNAEANRSLGLGFGLGFGIPVFLIGAGILAMRCLRGSPGTRTAQEAPPAAAASADKTGRQGPAREAAAAARAPAEEIEMDTFDPDIEAQPVAQALALQGHDDDGKRLLAA